MKVILIEKVKALGNIGEIVNVAEGFARNFLLPRKFAPALFRHPVERAEHLHAPGCGGERLALSGPGLRRPRRAPAQGPDRRRRKRDRAPGMRAARGGDRADQRAGRNGSSRDRGGGGRRRFGRRGAAGERQRGERE
jgi:hypothetical protein